MPGTLPHYKTGPQNAQVSTLIFGGQLVEYTTVTNPTTDLTVKPAAAGTKFALGIAGADGNVLAAQTGAPNTYGQPLIDISVLQDYVPVYFGGVDIWAWYSGAVPQGSLVVAGANGTLVVVGAGTFDQVVGRCVHPGGVSAAMLNQAIGGIGGATFRLARVRIF
jgi:hypothetical protein